MLEANYPNFFLDAGIDQQNWQQYGHRLDQVMVREGIAVADVVGVGEKGTGSNMDLYVVHRHAVTLADERGIFNKRVEVRPLCSTAAIARLRTAEEGFKGADLTLTGNDARGGEVLKITWGLGGPDWVEPLVLQQRQWLFEVISKAMDLLSEPPPSPLVSAAPSKAMALTAWATDVVEAAGVGVTDELVQEHANMVAGGIRFTVFLPMGARYGIDDLNQFYPGGQMPEGSPLETFDDLYAHVVAQTGDAEAVDLAIDRQLAGSWREFVDGCREAYS